MQVLPEAISVLRLMKQSGRIIFRLSTPLMHALSLYCIHMKHNLIKERRL